MIKLCAITLSALLVGNPVPHALFLRAEIPLYTQFDVFGDKLLNDPNHASHSRTQPHDHMTGGSGGPSDAA